MANAANDDDFYAVGVDIQDHKDGERLRLNFLDDRNGQRAVILTRSALPPVLGALAQRVGAGTVSPMNSGSLTIGQAYKPLSFDVLRRTDGTARLTLFETLLDQGRTVSHALELTVRDVADLVRLLS